MRHVQVKLSTRKLVYYIDPILDHC
jgi:hypothetical protein